MLAALLGDTIVTVQGRPWRGRDVVAAGALCGRWRDLEHELAHGLAAVREARAEPAEIASALRAFRYTRGLISADEFLAWATGRGLAVADVRAVLERAIVRARVAAPPPDGDETLRAAMVAALPAEAICTGALAECANWLADRMVVAADHELSDPVAAGASLLEHERGLLAVSVLDEPGEVRERRLAGLAAAAADYDVHVASICAPAAIARSVRRHAVDWTRYELTGLACPTAGAAAEAALMLRDEGAATGRVAELLGIAPQQRALRLDEAPGEMRGRLAAAHAGDVVGPVELDGTPWVWVVTARSAPDPSDPELVRQASRRLLDDSIQRLRAGKVRWHGRH